MRLRLPHLTIATLATVTSLLAFLGCQTGPEVTRIVNGRDASGRWVDPDAYAAYLDGVMAEERGDDGRAIAAYVQTIAEDREAAEAWARLGAVRCLRARADADRAFARARSLGAFLEDGWLAAAECDILRGHGASAVTNAERALALGPNDPEASRVLRRAFELAGDAERARRVLHAFTLRFGSTSEENSANAELTVKQALERGDVTTARSAARKAGIADADVAILALSIGRPALATPVASLALLSDPGDSSARIAGLSSADLERRDDDFARFARPLPPDRTRPNLGAVVLMGQLLSRRIGSDAARIWTEANGLGAKVSAGPKAASLSPCGGSGSECGAAER